ncbi:hypothetical protein BZM26_19135 [Paraburkholderia strydomiana]|nr:hypothetical protein BZM26_19135 [Paraburkholderia strydomiana]
MAASPLQRAHIINQSGARAATGNETLHSHWPWPSIARSDEGGPRAHERYNSTFASIPSCPCTAAVVPYGRGSLPRFTGDACPASAPVFE